MKLNAIKTLQGIYWGLFNLAVKNISYFSKQINLLVFISLYCSLTVLIAKEAECFATELLDAQEYSAGCTCNGLPADALAYTVKPI